MVSCDQIVPGDFKPVIDWLQHTSVTNIGTHVVWNFRGRAEDLRLESCSRVTNSVPKILEGPLVSILWCLWMSVRHAVIRIVIYVVLCRESKPSLNILTSMHHKCLFV